ncbi:MAG: MMPL family transporter, partial [Alphaproteobacteria bacterium]|nr:MMPL family transporter [Alphaproteobacteria bacterium]
LFAGLSLLQATLTLPGIAAIALTIGMAVDANVLIYERIKEELRNGLRPIAAIEAGYNRAMTTIIDANLTSLIGSAVLFEFGTGPIRGFAVNLALGILISMFTAIVFTKLIVAKWIGRKHKTTLPI